MSALNLVKADCRRILRDKPIRVIFIISVCFLVLYYLLFLMVKVFLAQLIIDGLGGEAGVADAAIESFINEIVSRMAFSGFMGVGGAAIFTCLASAIFLGGDFTFNTIRNKLISGNSRVKTYVSTCVTSAIVGLFIYIILASIALMMNFMMFGYNGGIVFKMALVYLPLYLWVSVFVAFIAMLTRSRSLTIVLSIIILTILPGLLETIAASAGEGNVVEVFNRYFPLTIFSEVMPVAKILNSLMYGLPGSEMTPEQFIEQLTLSGDVALRAALVPLGYMAVMIPFGAWVFTRTDIK